MVTTHWRGHLSCRTVPHSRCVLCPPHGAVWPVPLSPGMHFNPLIPHSLPWGITSLILVRVTIGGGLLCAREYVRHWSFIIFVIFPLLLAGTVGYHLLLKMKTSNISCDVQIYVAAQGQSQDFWIQVCCVQSSWSQGWLGFQDRAKATVFLVCWLGDSLAFKICIEFFGL